jgi:hypothetical protein
MPQPIAYNTGSQTSGSLKLNGIEYAISSSIVSGSNGQRWFTSVNPGNGIVLVTNSFTQSYSTYQNSTPLFYTASALTAAAITSSINGLPDRFGQVPFTTTASAYAWVANSRKYFMMNYEYPQIVTDRLSLLIDANFLASYPTTQSTWYDLSGKNNNGTLTNGPTWNSNGWFVFDGTDDYVDTSNTFQFTQSGQFSICGIINVQDHSFRAEAAAGIIGKGHYYSNSWDIWLYNNESVFFETSGDNSPSNVQYLASDPLTVGRWYFFAATYNNTAKNLWINETQYSNTYTGTGGFTNGNNVLIARRFGDASRSLIGSGSAFSIYSRALSTAEIKQNYFQSNIVTDGLVLMVDANNLVSYPKSGTTAYPLTSSINGTLINGTSFNSSYGGYWAFDGVDDYISWGDNFDLTSTSISGFVWGWANSLNYYLPWIDKLSSNGNYRFHADSIGRLIFGIRNTANAYEEMQTGVLVSTNTWYHLGFTFNNSTREGKIYVNGQVQLSYTFTIDRGDTTTNLQTGYQANNGGTLNGRIASLSLYNKTLTSDEVQQNFQAQRSRFGL